VEPCLSMITLGVSDLERARRFYRDGLGFPLSSASVDGVVAFFRTSGTVLALWSRAALAADAGLPDQPAAFGGFALAHNVPTREAVDAVLAQAAAAGGRLLKPGTPADWGGYTGYFADPDGHPWEVAWNPDFPLAADGTIQLPV
jgi:uncharacterized protein